MSDAPGFKPKKSVALSGTMVAAGAFGSARAAGSDEPTVPSA